MLGHYLATFNVLKTLFLSVAFFPCNSSSLGLHYQQAVRVNGGGLVRTARSGFLLVCRCFLQGVEPDGQCINLVQPGLKFRDFVTLRTNLT